jgi:hypothetical protein
VVWKGPIAAPRRSIDVSALTGWLTLQSANREAKRLDAIERTSVPRGGAARVETGAAAGSHAQPPAAPALPPPVVINRPPAVAVPRPTVRAVPAPPLFTPQ